MRITTARLSLPPIDDAYLTAMRAGRHVPQWAEDFPTAGDSMIASLYERTGVPTDERTQLFAHRLVVENATGLVIGGVGVKGPPREGAVEIGYGIVPSRRRRGYASEAVAGLVAALRLDPEVRHIEAQVDPANAASIGVLLRSGFVRTGVVDDFDLYRLPGDE